MRARGRAGNADTAGVVAVALRFRAQEPDRRLDLVDLAREGRLRGRAEVEARDGVAALDERRERHGGFVAVLPGAAVDPNEERRSRRTRACKGRAAAAHRCRSSRIRCRLERWVPRWRRQAIRREQQPRAGRQAVAERIMFVVPPRTPSETIRHACRCAQRVPGGLAAAVHRPRAVRALKCSPGHWLWFDSLAASSLDRLGT